MKPSSDVFYAPSAPHCGPAPFRVLKSHLWPRESDYIPEAKWISPIQPLGGLGSAGQLKQINYQDLKIRPFHLKIQFFGFSRQSLNPAAGPPATRYLSLELSCSCPRGVGVGVGMLEYRSMSIPLPGISHAAHFANVPRLPGPCHSVRLRPLSPNQWPPHPTPPKVETKLWFCSDQIPAWHLWTPSSLSELKGELCPWIHPREQLKLCKDSYSSVHDNDSYRKGWKRPNSSYCVPWSAYVWFIGNDLYMASAAKGKGRVNRKGVADCSPDMKNRPPASSLPKAGSVRSHGTHQNSKPKTIKKAVKSC